MCFGSLKDSLFYFMHCRLWVFQTKIKLKTHYSISCTVDSGFFKTKIKLKTLQLITGYMDKTFDS